MERKTFLQCTLAAAGSLLLGGKIKGLEYYPMPSTKRWAILYGTWCGSSRDAAVWISEGMGGIAQVYDVREAPDLSRFDHLIIGGSIRSNVTSPELQAFIKTQKAVIKPKLRGLFAVCGNMQQPTGPAQTTLFIENHLAALCEAGPLPSKVFNGRITKRLLDAATATTMATFPDYDMLKRADCMQFGSEVLEKNPIGKP